ncbi:MAG: FHA domain-containing protein, partial [Gemmataceae bacterium]
MARLRIRGPDGERELPLRERAVIGRLGESEIPLNSLEVSRRHAVISAAAGGGHILEDLGSSNGTYVNGTRVTGSTSLVPGDIIRIGPWEFTYQAPAAAEPSIVIHGELTTHSGNHQLFEQDATRKLRTVLDIAHHLSQFSSLQELLDRMLEHLLGLFGKADHALVLLRERAGLAVRAARARTPAADLGVVYSRSVVRRVLEEGVAVVGAEDSVVTEGE